MKNVQIPHITDPTDGLLIRLYMFKEFMLAVKESFPTLAERDGSLSNSQQEIDEAETARLEAKSNQEHKKPQRNRKQKRKGNTNHEGPLTSAKPKPPFSEIDDTMNHMQFAHSFAILAMCSFGSGIEPPDPYKQEHVQDTVFNVEKQNDVPISKDIQHGFYEPNPDGMLLTLN